jgi:hypothetical protein
MCDYMCDYVLFYIVQGLIFAFFERIIIRYLCFIYHINIK